MIVYDREEVFIWKDNKWINPKLQTYGCSFNIILFTIFKYKYTIPIDVFNGETTNYMGFIV